MSRFLYVEMDDGSVIASNCTGCGCVCTVNGKPRGEPHPVHSCCLIGAVAHSPDCGCADCQLARVRDGHRDGWPR